MKHLGHCLMFFFITHLVCGQVDTTEVNELQEVLLVGNVKREAVSKTLFSVSQITRHEITQMGASNLADVLNQGLNININPNPATGRSTISMFGLDGGYVKILIDNIPMVSDNGYGADIDIMQINLDNIERIEIVEGAMGVLYGDNAVAGVINIITKKSAASDWNISAYVQEETVGSEYNFQDEGRHKQQVRVSHNVSDELFASVGYAHADFKGFFNDYGGKNYFGVRGSTIVNDLKRGYEWNPKEQHTLDASLSYRRDRFRLYYKFEYYNEDLDVFNHSINSRIVDGNYVVTANDENFKVNRFSHQLQSWGSFKNEVDYRIALSYQNQERDYKNYIYNIGSRQIQDVTRDYTNQSSDLIFSKGSLSNLFPHSPSFNMTAGYEIVYQEGYDATAGGDYSSRIAEENLGNYDLFVLADLDFIDQVSFHPGLRLNNNSNYGSHLIWSVSTNYNPSETLNFKAVLGSAYKTPTFTNLYYYFVDSNHDLRGNPDLEPENGFSGLVSVDKVWDLENQSRLRTSLKGYYFDIEDKIDLAVVGDNNRLQYMNINEYRVAGISTENNLQRGYLRLGLGMSLNGISQSLGTAEEEGDFLFNFNANASASYLFPTIDTRLSARLKYNGEIERYIQDQVTQAYVRGKQDSFTWLDVSAQKSFFDRSLELTLGVRNLFDVVQVNNTAMIGQSHDAADTSLLMGHGRSYFVKLAFNLDF